MSRTKIGLAAAAAAAAGALIRGAPTLANAATGTSTLSASSTASSSNNSAPTHTAVTGDELPKVTDAIKAKDSSVTVTKVQKDADGSYDVDGTKSGSNIRYDVSADLKTITEGPAGAGNHDGGPDSTSNSTTSN